MARWIAALLLAGCSNTGGRGAPPPERGDEPRPPGAGRIIGNVGNSASGFDDQPDWEGLAKQARRKMTGRFPETLPPPKEACTKMLDAARDHYRQTDGEDSSAAKMMAATREADLAACISATEPKVAWCTATLVADDYGEYPFVLDQCTRAFGTGPAPGPAAPPASAAAPAPSAKAKQLEMTFVGDVIFGRYRPDGYDPIPEDGIDVFADMHDAMQSDMLVGNLETPLVRELPTDSPIGSKFRFGASLDLAQNLVKGGFSVVTLANNHYYDMRAEGLQQTPKLVRELGIVPIGAARAKPPLFRIETAEKNGWRVGFIAVSARRNAPSREGVPDLPFLGASEMDEKLSPLVTKAAEDHDLVVVAVHWGNEYAEDPDFSQIKAAHALIDAGADIVMGHHPHVLQGIEAYNGGLIAYSLGNFLFENTTDPPRLTGVLRVRFREDCYDEVVFHPAYIKRRPVQHPVPATGFMGKQVKGRVIAQAKRRGTIFVDDGDDLKLETVTCGGS